MAKKAMDLDKNISGTQNIMMNAYTSILIVRELLEIDNVAIANRDDYLKYTFAIHWRMAIVELYKLFPPNSKNDKFGIKFLLENVKSKKYVVDNITEQQLDELLSMIDNYKEEIQIVNKLRNTLYAHSSEHSEDYTHTLTIPRVLQLIKIVSYILNQILTANNKPPYEYEVWNFHNEAFKNILDIIKKEKEILKEYERIILKPQL